MVHSVSRCTPGVQVKLWDPLRMCDIPERHRGVIMTRRYTNPRLPLPLPLPLTVVWYNQEWLAGGLKKLHWCNTRGGWQKCIRYNKAIIIYIYKLSLKMKAASLFTPITWCVQVGLCARQQSAVKWRLEGEFTCVLSSRCQGPLSSAWNNSTPVQDRPDGGSLPCQWRRTPDLCTAAVSSLLVQRPVRNSIGLFGGAGLRGQT